MQVVSHPFTRWSVTHQGVFDSLSHTGFTYEQTTDVFSVRSVVKNEGNCFNNLTRYSNKPLIITVTTVSAISVAVTVPLGATYAPVTLLNTSISLAVSSVRNFTPTV